MAMWYWSVAIMFWQLSIDHIVNGQCKRCWFAKTRLRHPSLPFDSFPYPTRTICRRVRTYARSVTWQPKEKRLTIFFKPYSMSMGLCPTRASRAREPRYKVIKWNWNLTCTLNFINRCSFLISQSFRLKGVASRLVLLNQTLNNPF